MTRRQKPNRLQRPQQLARMVARLVEKTVARKGVRMAARMVARTRNSSRSANQSPQNQDNVNKQSPQSEARVPPLPKKRQNLHPQCKILRTQQLGARIARLH